MLRRNRTGISLFLRRIVAPALLISALVAQSAPDYSRLVPTLNGNIPRVVPSFPIPSFPVDTRPMFDNFIWQNFIAIMWPSRVQDLGQPFQPNNPAVFGRYTADLQPAWLRWKAAWELFPPDNSAPLPWSSPTVNSVCVNVNAATDHRPQLIRVQKFGTVADELAQAFGGPLPD